MSAGEYATSYGEENPTTKCEPTAKIRRSFHNRRRKIYFRREEQAVGRLITKKAATVSLSLLLSVVDSLFSFCCWFHFPHTLQWSLIFSVPFDVLPQIGLKPKKKKKKMSDASESTLEQARDLLTYCAWFRECDNDLLLALAAKMVPMVVPEGHLFVEEGDDVTQIIILDTGRLIRTKFSVDDIDTQRDEARQSVRDLSMRASMSGRELLKGIATAATEELAIVVDVKRKRGDVVGLLHSMISGPVDRAFATITAAPSEGGTGDVAAVAVPCKAWLLAVEDFREVVSTHPSFALQMMHALAVELRSGSKSLRGLMKHVTSRFDFKQGQDVGADGVKVCRVMCYDATSWTTDGFKEGLQAFHALPEFANGKFRIEMDFTTERLSEKSASYAAGYDAVCLFVNDNANADVLQTLSLVGVRMIAMRCAGFDRVDCKVARAYGLTVARVPAYSPYAVAEMAISLLMAVNRKVCKASNRVRMANFTLDAGLMGVDIYGKTVRENRTKQCVYV
jgi:D-isomer specific 2-hydroxyacid dehydrogenase, catalytic domain